jgi:RNA polymerase sigma-70 factor (ECF subfamily)
MGGSEHDVPSRLGARELFVAHAPFVARFLTRLGARPSDLNDLVQEVFLVAHRQGGFTPGQGSATTWLAHVAMRVAANARRGLRRRPEQTDEGALEVYPSTSGDPHRSAEVTESLARVEHALSSLGREQRALFVLFEIEGESCEAIALGLGIPLGTVYSRLHKARKNFRRAYERPRWPRSAVGRVRQEEQTCR